MTPKKAPLAMAATLMLDIVSLLCVEARNTMRERERFVGLVCRRVGREDKCRPGDRKALILQRWM